MGAKKVKKRMHIVPSVIVSVLFGSFMLALVTYVTFSLILQKALSGDVLKEAVASVTQMSVNVEIPKHDAVVDDVDDDVIPETSDDVTAPESDAAVSVDPVSPEAVLTPDMLQNGTVDASVYEMISQMVGKEELTAEVIESIVVETNIMGTMAESYSEYLLTGETDKALTAESIVTIIEENKDVIEEKTGYAIQDEDLQMVETVLNENEEVMQMLNPENALSGMEEITSATRMLASLISMEVILACAIGILILMLLIAVITRRLNCSLVTLAISALLTGGTLFAIVAVKNELLAMLPLEDTYKNIINTITAKMLDGSCKQYGTILLAAAAVLILISIVIKVAGSRNEAAYE